MFAMAMSQSICWQNMFEKQFARAQLLFMAFLFFGGYSFCMFDWRQPTDCGVSRMRKKR